MKAKLIGPLLLASGIFLVGCSNTASVDNSEKENEKDTTAVVKESEEDEKEEVKEDPLLVTDGKLLEIGQYSKAKNDSTGIVTLLGISNAQHDIPVGENKIFIYDIKVLKHSDYTDAELEGYTVPDNMKDSEGNFYVLQIVYRVKNESDNDIGYNGLEYAVTNTGQQINFMNDDFAYSIDTSDFFKHTESKDYLLLAYLNPNTVNEITEVTIKTGDTYNLETYDPLATSQEATFTITK